MSRMSKHARIQLVSGTVAVALCLSAIAAPACIAATFTETEARRTDSFGCLVGAAGASIVAIAVLAISVPALAVVAMSATTVAPILGAGIAAGCVMGASAAPATIWLFEKAVDGLVPLFRGSLPRAANP
jgi:hypothetical protein